MDRKLFDADTYRYLGGADALSQGSGLPPLFESLPVTGGALHAVPGYVWLRRGDGRARGLRRVRPLPQHRLAGTAGDALSRLSMSLRERTRENGLPTYQVPVRAVLERHYRHSFRPPVVEEMERGSGGGQGALARGSPRRGV